MTPIDRVMERLRALRGRGAAWGEGCPAGEPLPETERCAGTDCDSLALTELGVGEEVSVTCLQAAATPASAKLAALGVLPGARLRLVQRYPAFVFRMGYSEFALDAELAGRVRVRRD